jgi:molybdate transport system substrate-binding protein
MIKRLFLSLLCCLFLGACVSGNFPALIAGLSSQVEGQTLTVLAAASLTEAFSELATAYESEHPGATVHLNFAGSQQLAGQLAQGAPADVFASANQKQMQAVIETGRIQGKTGMGVDIFAANRLTVIYPAGNPANLQDLSDLAKPGVKLVIADNAVPVGYYTHIFLDRAALDPGLGPGFKTGVLGNVVSYENTVRAVLSKVLLGEADAGIVYTSDTRVKDDHQFGQIPIPEDLNTTASYYIAPLNDSPHKQAAQAFIDFVLSPDGQAILEKYGFIAVR